MRVNKKKIVALKPCRDRLDNYLSKHETFSGTMTKFLGLGGISHEDKLWVYFRLIPKDRIRLVAADLAEACLHIFESRYPNDSRPRKAVEAARSGDNAAAAYAAYAAAAAYADAAYAATDADADAAAAAYARTAERQWQLKRLGEYLRGESENGNESK